MVLTRGSNAAKGIAGNVDTVITNQTSSLSNRDSSGIRPRKRRRRDHDRTTDESSPIRSSTASAIDSRPDSVAASTSDGVYMPRTALPKATPKASASAWNSSKAQSTFRPNVPIGTNQTYGSGPSGSTHGLAHLQLDGNIQVKILSLPVLDNLACQIINILAKSSYQDIVKMATQPESEPGRVYKTLKGLFDQTKRIYHSSDPFLSATSLGLHDPIYTSILRRANTATFASSIFGSQEISFRHLDEHFLETFVLDGHQIQRSQVNLLLELKTQAYISVITTGDRQVGEILDELFPNDMALQLLRRRPGSRQLAAGEKYLLQEAARRKQSLEKDSASADSIAMLPRTYLWQDFLKNVSAYITQAYNESIATETVDQRRIRAPRDTRQANNLISDNLSSNIVPDHRNTSTGTMSEPSTTNNGDDIASKAQRAARFAMQDFDTFSKTTTPVHQHKRKRALGSREPKIDTEPQELQFHFENELHPDVPAPQMPAFFSNTLLPVPEAGQTWYSLPGSASYLPHSAQSAPTQILYERARQAAASKVSSSPSSQSSISKRNGQPSQRRPWTVEEENWLMAGLDRVKGPHWSQILAMFGPGGTINEVLKDRNQVQLKDKARNLKLFFLKSSIEVPYYLQFVTGELKTRAPIQAARVEARKNGKRLSEEDRKHVEGVMALAAGATQDPSVQNGAGIPHEHEPSLDPALDMMQQQQDDTGADHDDLLFPQYAGESTQVQLQLGSIVGHGVNVNGGLPI